MAKTEAAQYDGHHFVSLNRSFTGKSTLNGKALLGWKDWDTTWEAFTECQRIFTLKNSNNICYNRCQEQSLESFMIPACWKCHSSTDAPRVAEGAVGHGSTWSRGSLIPYFPAVLLSGASQAFSPCWKMQCRPVVVAMDTPLLPTPSSPAQALPLFPIQELWDQHVLRMSLQYPQLSQEEEMPDPDPAYPLPWGSWGKAVRVPHSWSKGESQEGRDPSSAPWRAGHGTALPGAVAAPTPNPLGTYGVALTQNQVSLQSWWS